MAMSVVYTVVNGMILSENRGGVETEFVPDTLGSVWQTRDMNGNVTSTTEYWPYGEIQSQTGTNPSKFGFVGLLGYVTDMANMLYVRARFYRPALTRWQTVDPIWPRQAPYKYCQARPVSWSDPTGLGPRSVQRLPLGDVVTACLLGGGFAALLDVLTEAPLSNTACNAGVNCLGAMVGAAVGLLAEEFGPIIAGCIAGLVSSAIGAAGQHLCARLPGCSSKQNSLLCDVVAVIAGTIGGCLGGAVEDVNRIVASVISAALGAALGTSGGNACSFATS